MTEEAPDLPESTAPQSIRMVTRKFKDAEYEKFAAEQIGAIVRDIGRVIDISSLDGITIAFDYDEALADLDRGIPEKTKMTRTSNQQIVGVGKTAAVLRDGIVKSHILLLAPVVLQVLDEQSKLYRTVIYLLAHECGHVEEHMIRDRLFPGMLLRYRPEHREDRLLEPAVEAIWAEYAACIVSARFDRSQTQLYAGNIIKSVEALRREAIKAILEYRIHGDLWRLESEAMPRILEPLRLAAYLIGHLDGLGEDWSRVPEARQALEKTGYWPIVERMTEDLRNLWDTRDTWTSLKVFEPMKDRLRETLKHGGLHLTRLESSYYLNVPLTPETTPPM